MSRLYRWCQTHEGYAMIAPLLAQPHSPTSLVFGTGSEAVPAGQRAMAGSTVRVSYTLEVTAVVEAIQTAQIVPAGSAQLIM